MSFILKIKKLNQNAKLPTYAHPGDAGLDLFALEDVTIAIGDSALIKTGIAMEIPDGYVGLIWDKSGLAVKNGLKTMAGVVDSGYRGEVLVCLVNLSQKRHDFSAGDKIAQMIIQKKESFAVEEVPELDQNTSRGMGGFGSTGKK
jgi:dUTP pyrophosphatase